jgi:hypothetical protein
MNNTNDWPPEITIRRNGDGALVAYSPPRDFGAPPWELELLASYRTERSGDVVSFMARRRLRDRTPRSGGGSLSRLC